MTIKIIIKGIPETSEFLKKQDKNILISQGIGLSKATFYLHGKVKQSIARGINAPVAVDTGRFLNSVNLSSTNDEGMVFTDVEYAKYIEYGTSKMSARPHFGNTAKKEKGNVLNLVSEEIKTVIK